MLNSVILIGRLTRDPELRYTPSGTPVARFTLAVDRRTKNSAGERQTDFIRISCWNKTAELVSNYMQKGRLVAVEGSLRVNSVSNPDGTRREYVEVVCNSVQFLERRDAAGPAAADESEFAGFGEALPAPRAKQAEEEDDDVPF